MRTSSTSLKLTMRSKIQSSEGSMMKISKDSMDNLQVAQAADIMTLIRDSISILRGTNTDTIRIVVRSNIIINRNQKIILIEDLVAIEAMERIMQGQKMQDSIGIMKKINTNNHHLRHNTITIHQSNALLILNCEFL